MWRWLVLMFFTLDEDELAQRAVEELLNESATD
jgi:hypothetical protein